MLNRRLMTILAGSVLAVLPLMGLAQAMPVKTPEALIIERLQQARPDMEFTQPRPAPIKGLYQVQVVGGPVLYVTPEADMFIAGDLLSIEPTGFGRVEDPYMVEQRKRLVSTIDAKTTINFKPEGETKAVVYVFTDVDCGFCRRLHNQVHSYKDNGVDKPGYNDLGIEVRYLAYPRAGVNSPSGDKLVTAWCADDQQDAMTKLKNLQPVATKKCATNPVAAQYAMGAEVGVSGTPAILLTNGTMIGGYLPPEELARRLGL